MDFLIYTALLAGLLLITALLVACEISLVKLRYSLIEESGLQSLRTHRRIAYLMDNADWTAQVIRFGIMACTLGSGFAVLPILLQGANWLIPGEGAPLLHGLFALFGFFIAVSLVSLLGFRIPRGFALTHPILTLRTTSWFVVGFTVIALPWFKMLRALTRKLFKCFGILVREDYNVLDFEIQIRALGEGEPTLTPFTRMILRNTLRISELDVSDILLPRREVKYFDIEDTLAENLAMARETGHTRFPLVRGDLDNCIGVIHIKDLFRAPEGPEKADLLKLRREIISFSANAPLEEALQGLLAHKMHMALVKDEFGGTAGVVTLETILEALVGEIEDEFDTTTEDQIIKLKTNEYQVDGLTPIHDLEEYFNISIANEEVSTFGGLITAQLGHIPEAGEVFELTEPRLHVCILEVDEKRILSAKVSMPNPVEEGHTDSVTQD